MHYILQQNNIIIWLKIKIIDLRNWIDQSRYQYFDSCCGCLRDEHLLGVAFLNVSLQLNQPRTNV